MLESRVTRSVTGPRLAFFLFVPQPNPPHNTVPQEVFVVHFLARKLPVGRQREVIGGVHQTLLRLHPCRRQPVMTRRLLIGRDDADGLFAVAQHKHTLSRLRYFADDLGELLVGVPKIDFLHGTNVAHYVLHCNWGRRALSVVGRGGTSQCAQFGFPQLSPPQRLPPPPLPMPTTARRRWRRAGSC